jgi:hypothetical protein
MMRQGGDEGFMTFWHAELLGWIVCWKHSEFWSGELLHLTLNLVPRFPNPVPEGIRVPRWAILDVTVCFKFFLTAPS